MVKCKICERDIHEDKLINHSLKCSEVVEIKAELAAFQDTMDSFADKANLMKNRLEANASLQKRLQKKALSRMGTLVADAVSPGLTCSTKETHGNQSFQSLAALHELRNDSPEGENNISEEEVNSPSRTFSRFSFREQNGVESVKKMTMEEYQKFSEEVKKSIFALKKVHSYATKIVEWALEISQLDDPNQVSINELQIIYDQVGDTNVLEFIAEFKSVLTAYVKRKADYISETKKLIHLSYDRSTDEAKEKYKTFKSVSMKKNNGTLRSGFNPGKFRDSNGSSREGSRSPSSKGKKTAPKNNVEFASPFLQKRMSPGKQISTNNGLKTSLVTNGNGGSPGKSTSNSLKGKISTNGLFLQTNFNHINPQTTRKGPEETSSINRDKLRITVCQKFEYSEKTDTPSPRISSSNGTNSPGALSPHLSSLTLYKENSRQRKSKFSTNAHKLGLSTPGSPTTPKDSKFEEIKTAEPGSFTQEVKTAKRRANSLGAIKKFHVGEIDTSPAQFPSLLNGVGNLNIQTDNSPISALTLAEHSQELMMSKIDSGPARPDRFAVKKKKSDEGFNQTSPSMRSCSSDPNHKWKRKLPFMNLNQVSIDDFKFLRFLGKGAYGTVWLVEKRGMGDLYAMKIVDWTNRYTQNRMMALKAEKDIYEVLEGDFVVKAIWTFNCGSYICFVTEYMVGGDFNKIMENLVRLENDQARFYAAELIQAVECLHNLKIVHRDLKPDNILMDAKGHIRLTDFGLSQKGLNILRGNNTPSGKKSNKTSPVQGVETSPKDQTFFNRLSKMQVKTNDEKVEFMVKSKKEEGENIFGFLGKEQPYTAFDPKKNIKKQSVRETLVIQDKKVRMIGTPDYMAPEVIDPDRLGTQSYNERCMDWWSVGVILYEFLVGIPPFNADTREMIFDNILKLNIEWPDIGYEEDNILPEAADLISKLLDPDPSKRLGARGAQEIKSHDFFKDFNWEGLREQEAPIIPRAPDLGSETGDEGGPKPEEIKHPFSEPESKKKPKLGTTNKQSELLQSFRMERTDVLHKLNEEHVRKLQKQKTVGKF